MKLILGLMLTVLPVFAAKKKSKPAMPVVNYDQELKTREYMIEISRQLGVTCDYCHDVKKFKDSGMKTWKISKDHIRIVALLNTKGFLAGPKADCYLCHRGKAVPEFHEKPMMTEENKN